MDEKLALHSQQFSIFPSFSHSSMLSNSNSSSFYSSIRNRLRGIIKIFIPIILFIVGIWVWFFKKDAYIPIQGLSPYTLLINTQYITPDFINTNFKNFKSVYTDHIEFLGSLLYAPSSPSPEIVVVTSLTRGRYTRDYMDRLINTRKQSILKSGNDGRIGLYMTENPDSKAAGNPPRMSPMKMVRGAMHTFPKAEWIVYLAEYAVMDWNSTFDLSVERLEPEITRGVPIVPNSVILSYRFNKVKNMNFVIPHDGERLDPTWFAVRNPGGIPLMEFWGDDMFELSKKNEFIGRESLEHLLQWHPSFLGRTGLTSLNYSGLNVKIVDECKDMSNLNCMKSMAKILEEIEKN